MTALDATYRRLAPVYDLLYGVGLEHGRRRAIARLAPRAGESLLEIGVGTGLSARDYPPGCQVTAIDLSAPMLERARARLARQGVRHVTLLQMDATRLAFPDGVFDAVYAPYVINVVADPVAVVREMARVCRPGGRLVLLNHFANGHVEPRLVRMAIGVAARLGGVDSRLKLKPLLDAIGLTAASVDPVNFKISSVVVCHKPPCFHGAHS